MRQPVIYLTLFCTFLTFAVSGQEETNYDEDKVPEYTLPELLVSKNGREITNSRRWNRIRRPEILSMFEEYMYGKIPGELNIESFRIIERDENALGGKAVRKQVILEFYGNGRNLEVHLLKYLPRGATNVPVFLGYNFGGNHTVSNDPEIAPTRSWVRNSPQRGIEDNRATEQSRGDAQGRWDIEQIIDSGYGLVTLYYGDVFPDKDDFTVGVHPLLYSEGQEKPLPGEWGAISAWAWGLKRVMDYFEEDPGIDQEKVIVMGHSRLGKTALWAGALDERFAMVISNNSGCGGAALSRRRFGERLGRMNENFPHWLCENNSRFDWDEDSLPVDQHMLIALMAPRPVYIASAEEDRWADPKGEYLSGHYATEAYRLFGKDGLPSGEMPALNNPVMNTIGFHIRPGAHSVLPYDWEQFIRFANLHLK